MTSFAENILILGKQKVAPIASWDEVVSQLEAWAMFYTFFLGDNGFHPATYDIFSPPGGYIWVQPEAAGASLPKTYLPHRLSFASYSRSSMRASARRWRGSSE